MRACAPSEKSGLHSGSGSDSATAHTSTVGTPPSSITPSSSASLRPSGSSMSTTPRWISPDIPLASPSKADLKARQDSHRGEKNSRAHTRGLEATRWGKVVDVTSIGGR